MSEQPTLKYCFSADESLTGAPGPALDMSRNSTATWYGNDGLIKTAAIDAARFDHNPTTLQPLGLLVEGSTTNLGKHSEDMSQTPLTFRVGFDLNATTAPDGELTADRIRPSVISGSHSLSMNESISDGLSTYTVSYHLKNDGARYVCICPYSGQTVHAGTIYDLEVGVVTSEQSNAGATHIDSGMIDVGDGWYRCWMTYILGTAAGHDVYLQGSPTGTASIGNYGSIAYLPSASGLDWFAWGYQLEVGPILSSYIPTGASTVTRASDHVDSSNVSWFNESEGTIFVKFSQLFDTKEITSAFEIYNSITPTTNTHRIGRMGGAAGNVRYQALPEAQIEVAGFANLSAAVAAGYKVNDFIVYADGNGPTTDSLGAVPALIDKFHVGRSFADAIYANGHIAEIRYYNERFDNETIMDMTQGIFPEGNTRNWLTVSRRKLDRPPTKRVYPKPKPNMRSTYE